MLKERPILFSGPMVRAILEGRKTQTRRVIEAAPSYTLSTLAVFTMQPDGNVVLERWPRQERMMNNFGRCERYPCPYGVAGDRLWVRETFTIQPQSSITSRDLVFYRADVGNIYLDGKWKPPIFMPRWASRITLKIADVRVQRLQEISVKDCLAEGISTTLREAEACSDLVDQYRALWDSINGKSNPWTSNPWVWVITFKRIAPEQK